MAKRRTALDHAIDAIDREIAILQLARAFLVKQQLRIPAKKPRVKDTVADG